MKPTINFFPVGNGDMTLIKLADKTTILIDINICNGSEDDDDSSKLDASKELRGMLETDEGRPYVDAFLLSHPDQDHCRGLQKHFHLGPLSTYNDNPPEGEELKIIMREIWSSPMIFRRASKNHTLCEDAKAFNTEAKRRVKLFRENGYCSDGDRIRIIGEDEAGKTDGLESILVKIDEVFTSINGKENSEIAMRVLGPIPVQDDEVLEEKLKKNHSSVILQYAFTVSGHSNACLFLSGGDAEVYIWEKVWNRKKNITSDIQFDLMLAPHHCSWHTLSYDSWSKDKAPKVTPDAKLALSQARDGAVIVASSNPIKNDKNDPPCWGAKEEYESILDSVGGQFFCTGEYQNAAAPEVLTFKITPQGAQEPAKKSAAISGAAVGAGSAKEPRHHG